MNIGRILSRKAVTVLASDPLSRAARLMCERHVGALVVLSQAGERGAPVGVITDRDVVKAQLEQHADLMMLSVERVMTRDPLLLTLETPLETAVEKMRARGVRRCPVVDAKGLLVGVVSTDDIITALAIELGNLARLIGDQPLHEGELKRRIEQVHHAVAPTRPAA